MTNEIELTIVYAGRHLSMLTHGNWELATRNTKKPAVGIVAITDAGNVVLVEQYCPPLDKTLTSFLLVYLATSREQKKRS